ncbi:MAG: response regulator [Acidobacteria bacterium]|nr:MAG: response regulator [Acidobacteriota bacterium]
MRASVLLVDDNRNFLRVMTYLIKEMGLDPKPAQSAEEGLAILSSTPVALVITDLRMPGIYGMQFLREVGKRRDGVPTVVLTAFDSPELRRQVAESGAVFLAKSAGREELKRLVLTLLAPPATNSSISAP